MPDDEFTNRLASIIHRQAERSRRDPSLYAEMIERLSASRGLAIAMAAKGDGAKIDTLIEGATAYVYDEAASWAPLARVSGAA